MAPGIAHATLPQAASDTLATSSTTSGSMTAADASPPGDHPSIWSGFYQKALKERQALLRMAFPHLFRTSLASSLIDSGNSGTATLLNGSSSPALQPKYAVGSGAASPSLTMSGNSNAATGKLMRAMQLSSAASAGLSGSNGALDSSGRYGEDAFPIRGLEENIADHMIENCIGTMGIPVGLALNFVINGVPTVVPMAVEEPSVVAAVSGAAKTLSSSRDNIGFRTTSPARNIITAQVLLLDVPDDRLADVEATILAKKKDVLAAANQYCSNMHKRGGGVINLLVRKVKRQSDSADSHIDKTTTAFLAAHLPRSSSTTPSAAATTASASTHWLVVHLHIDVCDAMGANCASTVAEGVAPVLVDLAGPGARSGLRIVSNLNPDRLSRASFRIPVESLAYKGFSGAQVAARVIEAYQWARDDPYRATTHNKGIMNGIDAVALATGQDWRAVEAACHSWAAGNGQEGSRGYSSLTRYWVEKEAAVNPKSAEDEWVFCGELALPIIVGTKGGVLATAPVYQYTLGMMGFPDSKQLAAIMCCIGLAQNFAALRALATEGIQRGHMHLHARNIAIAAGAPTHAIPKVTAWMIEKGRISVDAAREYV
ncbi:hydroxymethylglutaryl-CoA reductase [Catenaria anguillulae PL171]|uniref:hydroxymethylglutaryl-CoA reductase (NADPH) n=1 Tax=Catenaria anguillulae PL171 TaxID=765915 RepID=A0A1Y2H912_9FUNG|nr:hydroxymethylglutaryl-CoA reductase [Catenaria anguillulae PL171]